jgi:hypothetical protein
VDPTGQRQTLLLQLLQELGAAMRLRSEPEHLYTAASIAGFGAVAWGVSALQLPPMKCETFCCALQKPFLTLWVAAIGTIVIAAMVIKKIYREHHQYGEFQKARAEVMDQLAELAGAEVRIPDVMRQHGVGDGHRASAIVVSVAAAAAVGFCVCRIYVG